MSWQQAKSEAEIIYLRLRDSHTREFTGMVIDALRRLHARDKPKSNAAEEETKKEAKPPSREP
jgi:hypothetical protein